MDDNQRLLDIAAGLYDAALDESRWPEALQRMCEFFASTAIYLFVIDHATGLVPFGVSYGFDRSKLAEYDNHYVKTDPGAAFSLAHPEIKLQYNYLHTPEAEMDHCEYHDWLQRVAGLRYYFAAKLYHTEAQSAYASFNRTRREGHVDPHTLDLFGRIVPHLERSVQISQRFANLKLQAAASAELVQRLPFGVILLGMDGRVIFMNQAAERIIAAADGLAVAEQRLCALRRTDDAPLQRLMAEAIGMAVSFSAGGSLSVPRRSGKRSYSLLVTPLPREAIGFASEHPAAAVIITDPEQPQALPEDTLRRLYGLTRTEALLAGLLVSGLNLKQAAVQMNIATKTVRLHLEHIFAKTQVHRQADLIKLLLTSTILHPAG